MKESTRSYTLISIISIPFVLIFIYIIFQFFNVSDNFPKGITMFKVEENENLKSISIRLKKDGYITSPVIFRAGISFLGKDKGLQLGGYIFKEPLNLIDVIKIFVKGQPDAPLLSVTIPEGKTTYEIANLFKKSLPNFSIDIFGEMVSKYEADGKLFPSTYFLLPSYKEEDIVKIMLLTFKKKIDLQISTSSLPKPLNSKEEMLVLASILEGEANNEEDMKKVAGILIRRLLMSMPLQVDVAKETYKNKGLPFMPINNPGLISIQSVLNPIKTDYLYYLTGKDGKMYYAKTFEEHKRNIRKYLK